MFIELTVVLGAFHLVLMRLINYSSSRQLSIDFENAKRISQLPPKITHFSAENEAKIFASRLKEKGIEPELVHSENGFDVKEYFMPPLWLGIYEISNCKITEDFLKWARINGYSTSIQSQNGQKKMVAVGRAANLSFNLSFGIPAWYYKMSKEEISLRLNSHM